MQAQGQFVTLREGSEAKALIAPELGGWLLRYSRHLPAHGYIEALHCSEEVIARYPLQMYAGNPILFPMVSFNSAGGQEHHYAWQGTTYPMPQHGFARRLPWRTLRVSDSAVLLELRDTAETRAVYPFPFSCQVEYELRQGRLSFRQVVENQGERLMPFSTGIHPYFAVPLKAGSSRNDCYVELPDARRITPHGNWESWTAAPAPAHRLSVGEDVSGTLFFSDLAERVVRIVDPRARLAVSLDFTQSPAHQYVAVWSKSPTEPFYCIEPWTALPNAFQRPAGELILLPPGQSFRSEMILEIEELA